MMALPTSGSPRISLRANEQYFLLCKAELQRKVDWLAKQVNDRVKDKAIGRVEMVWVCWCKLRNGMRGFREAAMLKMLLHALKASLFIGV